jgi:hypothetical protein
VASVSEPAPPPAGSTASTWQYPDVPAGVWQLDAPRRAIELVRIGTALAETDRDQAGRVFIAAEHAARQVADDLRRFFVLAEATGLARRRAPDQARRFLGLATACAEDLDDPNAAERALVRIAELGSSLTG